MNPYGVDISERNVLGPITSLEVLYDRMPETSGCENCEKHNDKKDWCCLFQSPSMYYVEFLSVWMGIQNAWSREKKKGIVLKAIKNFLSNSLSKGCIFYNEGCLVYKHRPFGCRMYGIISKESWDKRWELLKERQGDKFEARPQCELVSSDIPVSAEKENEWFLHTCGCEKRIGVSVDILKLHDLPGGSYRTFHDHLMIEMFEPKVLEMLTTYRLSDPSEEDINKAMAEVGKPL